MRSSKRSFSKLYSFSSQEIIVGCEKEKKEEKVQRERETERGKREEDEEEARRERRLRETEKS